MPCPRALLPLPADSNQEPGMQAYLRCENTKLDYLVYLREINPSLDIMLEVTFSLNENQTSFHFLPPADELGQLCVFIPHQIMSMRMYVRASIAYPILNSFIYRAKNRS